MKVIFAAVACIFFCLSADAQQLIFPDSAGWTILNEGKLLHFTLKTTDPVHPKKFFLEGGSEYGMQIDTAGNFSWRPSYDLVDRLASRKEFSVIFHAEWKDGRRARHPITFNVKHVNRPPDVEDLPAFYVKQGQGNFYQISTDFVKDPDGDPLVFRGVQSQMPEGMQLSSVGVLSWNPSRSQFNGLKANPIVIPLP